MNSEQLGLSPHPDTPPCFVHAVSASLSWFPEGLGISYVVEAPTDRLVIPAQAKPDRTDELWRTTCLELFVKRRGSEYLEFNFSPSTQWAAYRFSAYRDGMKPLTLSASPKIESRDERLSLIASVRLDLPWGPPFAIGLSAVIEETDGTKSYWALRHPAGKPDFHHPDCFALELPAASAA